MWMILFWKGTKLLHEKVLKVLWCGVMWKVLTWWMSQWMSSSGTWTWWVFLSTVRLRWALSRCSFTVCQWRSSSRLPIDTRSCPPEKELIPENKSKKGKTPMKQSFHKAYKIFEIFYYLLLLSNTWHTERMISWCAIRVLYERPVFEYSESHSRHTESNSHIVLQLFRTLNPILGECRITWHTQGQPCPSIPVSLWNCTLWKIDIYVPAWRYYLLKIRIMMESSIRQITKCGSTQFAPFYRLCPNVRSSGQHRGFSYTQLSFAKCWFPSIDFFFQTIYKYV